MYLSPMGLTYAVASCTVHERMTKGKEIITSVRLPVEQHDALRKLAESQHRTFSQQLRLLIDQATDSQRSAA